MRRLLDGLYVASGAIAAFFIALICLLVTTQVIFNLLTKLGIGEVSLTIPSYADFAGFFLAMASFFALAYTLTRGGHIRVTLVTNVMPPKLRWVCEVLALFVAAATSLFATYFMMKLVFESHEFGDLSPGIVAIPLWIPQTGVTLGLLILTIALIDLLIRTLVSCTPVLQEKKSL